MQEALIVVRQVFLMFILMGLGWFLGKKDVLKQEAISSINTLVVYLAGPAIMIRSFDIPFSAEKAADLFISFFLSIVVMMTAVWTARIVFKKTDRIAQYAAVFNNCGFIGIPLVQAVVNEEAVFYLTIFMAVWNLMAWTYGMQVLKGSHSRLRWQNIVLNPATLAVGFGTLLFLSPLQLPQLINQTLSSLGGMNTPLAMLVLGHSITRIQLGQALWQPSVWKISLVRLLVIPIITFGMLSLLPASVNEIRMTLFIAACTPVGAMLTMFQGMLKQDTQEGSVLVSVSTLLSMTTLPLLLSMASIVWGL